MAVQTTIKKATATAMFTAVAVTMMAVTTAAAEAAMVVGR